MSLFQPKESFHSGNALEDEVFRLGTHGCEVMFTSYARGTVVGPSINTHRTKHLIISGSVEVNLEGSLSRHQTGEWFEIPQHQEHKITYLKDCSIIEFWFDQ